MPGYPRRFEAEATPPRIQFRAESSCLLPRLALRRHNAVHTKVFNDLPVVIIAVAHHLHSKIKTRYFAIASERARNFFGSILRRDRVDCAMRFRERALQVVDHFLLGLDVLWAILAGVGWWLLTHDSRTVCLQSIADVLELRTHTADRFRSLEVSWDIGRCRRKIELILRHRFRRSHNFALDAPELAIQDRGNGWSCRRSLR